MFIIAQEYKRDDLLEFVGSRQAQSGIIWGKKNETCVIVTSGGKGGKDLGYKDKWNEDGTFTYIGQGSNGDQNPNKFSNSLLINGERTVLLFTTKEPTSAQIKSQGNRKKLFKFEGLFDVLGHRVIAAKEGKRSGDKLLEFTLICANNVYSATSTIINANPPSVVTESDFITLRYKVKKEKAGSKEGVATKQAYIIRSRQIVEYALARANGICEYCKSIGPFLNIHGVLFLEVHHIFKLSDDGPDSPSNVAALCPNCHREAHFGQNRDIIKTKLAMEIRDKEDQLDKEGQLFHSF